MMIFIVTPSTGKTPDMPYKTVLALDASVSSFIDESAINGMEYTYRVFAADASGNVSNPTNEAKIGTVTIGKPDPPASASAEAYEEYIAVAIVPPTLAQDNRDIYAPVEYKIQISRNAGTSYSDIAVTGNTSYDYYFDRPVEGYPEISALNNYRFKISGVNVYGNLSTVVVTPVSTGNYLTWTPETPKNFRGSSTGRTLYLEWDKQSQIFGAIACRIQISVDGTTWYQPGVTKDPYAAEDNYRENSTKDAFLEITGSAFYQVVPLTGQNTALEDGGYAVLPRTYYYRVQAVNTVSGKVSAWSNKVELEAKGTSAQDMLNNSVGWDTLVDKSILFEKIGAKNFIGRKGILALIANDDDLSDKARQGFQYWALDNITLEGVQYKKGEFRINSDAGDYFIVDPVTGISFRASKLDIDTLGTNTYGNLNVFDKKGSGGLKQLSLVLVDDKGTVKAIPAITLGNSARKPEIDIYAAMLRILAGALNVGATGVFSSV
jgi:hypothetical protein